VKKYLNEQKPFTQRRKGAEAQRKQNLHSLFSLRLGVFARVFA
jgi:hypothetical protein